MQVLVSLWILTMVALCAHWGAVCANGKSGEAPSMSTARHCDGVLGVEHGAICHKAGRHFPMVEPTSRGGWQQWHTSCWSWG